MTEKSILEKIARLEKKSFSAFKAGNDKSLERIENQIEDLKAELASL